MSCAAPRARSSRAPMWKAMPYGPLTWILTVTDLPSLGFVTVKTVPSGQVRAAAVLPLPSNRSPLAVRAPEEEWLARLSCLAQLPDRFAYLCTDEHPAALAEVTVSKPIRIPMLVDFIVIMSPLQ